MLNREYPSWRHPASKSAVRPRYLLRRWSHHVFVGLPKEGALPHQGMATLVPAQRRSERMITTQENAHEHSPSYRR